MANKVLSQSSISVGSKQSNLWDTKTSVSLPAFESIATIYLAEQDVQNTYFHNIPQTYNQLQLRIFGRSSRSNASDTPLIIFNGNSSDYYFQGGWFLTGDGATASTGYQQFGSNNAGSGADLPAASTTTNSFGISITDIYGYSNPDKGKTIKSLGGFDANGSGKVMLSTVIWNNNAAINNISVQATSGSFKRYTHIALYGVR